MASSHRTAPVSSRRGNLRRGTAQSCRNVAAHAPNDFHRERPQRQRSFDDRYCAYRGVSKQVPHPSGSRAEPAKPMATPSPRSVMNIKVLDVAEAPSITTPYQTHRMRHFAARGGRTALMGRAKSERHFLPDASHYTPQRRGPSFGRSHTSPLPLPPRKMPASSPVFVDRRSTRPAASSLRQVRHQRSNRRESSFHSSWKEVDDNISKPITTRPPTATKPSNGHSVRTLQARRASSTRSLGSHLSGRDLEQKDTSAKAA